MAIPQKTGWEFGKPRSNRRGQPPHRPSPTARWTGGRGWALDPGSRACLSSQELCRASTDQALESGDWSLTSRHHLGPCQWLRPSHGP